MGIKSRNAVVALKQKRFQRDQVIVQAKQERRGGIETPPPGCGGGGVDRKQERRGGIETALMHIMGLRP